LRRHAAQRIAASRKPWVRLPSNIVAGWPGCSGKPLRIKPLNLGGVTRAGDYER
jgi:hypothetical protein